MQEETVKIKIDTEKATEIAKVLLKLHEQKHQLITMPEYQLPRNMQQGSKEHANYLTYIIAIDYMTDAEKLWKNARGAYELYPERFTPERILKASNPSLRSFLRKLGARYSSNAVKIWKKISELLLSEYGADPRNITPQPSSIEEIKSKLNLFPSLRGPKLTNFYIRAMGETGLFKVKNLNELDIPVDKQVTRFTTYTGVIRFLTQNFQGCANDDPLRSLIQKAWREAAKTLGTAPWKFDEPIWNIGSKLCTKRKCDQCPVEKLCDKIKGITFKENILIWKAQR
ncbi:MAG: hypothetical protein QXZ70_07700 [Candidatus Bathyarchaeia archaeon]